MKIILYFHLVIYILTIKKEKEKRLKQIFQKYKFLPFLISLKGYDT